MIGVVTHPEDAPVLREFFELFKTPWEFVRPQKVYDVVLSTTGAVPDVETARAFVVYSAASSPLDQKLGITVEPTDRSSMELFGNSIPIYGRIATIRANGRENGSSFSCVPVVLEGATLWRVGYNLLAEIRELLEKGQPEENATIPTLDLHICVLRQMILQSGVALVEIPPVPAEHNFIACLTHDIDFVSLRQHLFDHTMFGFLYRATIGSVLDWRGGFRPLSRVLRNFAAALGLPFVHLRCSQDYWLPFENYLKAENGRPSTFFIIPFRNTPGKPRSGGDNRKRATRYDVSDVSRWMSLICEHGGEVALHGVDAWHDSARAKEEAARIGRYAPKQPKGVRMHWLYFAHNSPEVLDSAGFDYDSTCGYNSAAGYRAGTSQVFQPFGAKHLLELPMHIQDTALFYADRMHLTESHAWEICLRVMEQMQRHGGVLTVLWHDRSLVPERLWGEFYARLIQELDSRGVWWATAGQVTEWFRMRRGVRFISEDISESHTRVDLLNLPVSLMPGLVLRLSWISPDGALHQREEPIRQCATIAIPRSSAGSEITSQPLVPVVNTSSAAFAA